jgi:hypothetical protein
VVGTDDKKHKFLFGGYRKHIYYQKSSTVLQEPLCYASAAQPFYTHGTLNIVKESWRHTNPILHIGGRGEMVYGIDWPRQIRINRPQPKNVLFDGHNYPSKLLCHLFKKIHYLK